MRKHFCLPRVPAKPLDITEINGIPIKPDDYITPRLTICPMGWSHALNVCLKVFTRLVRNVLPTIPFLDDHSPVPSMKDGCVSVYVDNFAAMGVEPEMTKRNKDAVLKEVKRVGLSTHDERDEIGDAILLGVQFKSGQRLVPRGDRRWRLYHAIVEARRRGRLTSCPLSAIL